jgi:2-hydroxycyclohexanecarboxyl-CoA dehydrogenase
MRFSGRVALVVGGASGIGRATAERLALEGARVAVADLDVSRATHVAVGMAGAQAFEVDVVDPGSVTAMVADVESVMGAVDVMVQAAGWDRVVHFVETDPDFWARVLAVNLGGAIAVAHAVLPGMVERERGALRAERATISPPASTIDDIWVRSNARNQVSGTARSSTTNGTSSTLTAPRPSIATPAPTSTPTSGRVELIVARPSLSWARTAGWSVAATVPATPATMRAVSRAELAGSSW